VDDGGAVDDTHGADAPGAPDPRAALQRVVLQLAEIQRRLLDTPGDDLAARHALRTVQDQLRAEAAALRGARPLSDEERRRLEQRLALLEHRREALVGGRITARQTVASTNAGVGGTGGAMNGAALLAIDQAILAAGGLVGLRHEIAVLEQRLAAG
jgi:hypothetical protein